MLAELRAARRTEILPLQTYIILMSRGTHLFTLWGLKIFHEHGDISGFEENAHYLENKFTTYILFCCFKDQVIVPNLKAMVTLVSTAQFLFQFTPETSPDFWLKSLLCFNQHFFPFFFFSFCLLKSKGSPWSWGCNGLTVVDNHTNCTVKCVGKRLERRIR